MQVVIKTKKVPLASQIQKSSVQHNCYSFSQTDSGSLIYDVHTKVYFLNIPCLNVSTRAQPPTHDWGRPHWHDDDFAIMLEFLSILYNNTKAKLYESIINISVCWKHTYLHAYYILVTSNMCKKRLWSSIYFLTPLPSDYYFLFFWFHSEKWIQVKINTHNIIKRDSLSHSTSC